MNNFGMNPMLMNPMIMNNFGMMGMNNQQNLMDENAIRIKNIIQPYENKIKELEEIIRQKDFEIAVLKQKLNNYSSNINFMNINPMMMNQIINPMMMQEIFPQNLENKGQKLEIKLKTENSEFINECYEKDKVSILFEKNNINKGVLIHDYKVLKGFLTFERKLNK